MSNNYTLKYLFIAEFIDGSAIEQTLEDKSSIDPEKRSQFYDVLQSGKRIHRFSLVGEGNKLTVDLLTGFFEVNGLRVMLEGDKLPTLPDRFDLIFYRQHTHDTAATFSLKTKNLISQEETDHYIEYFIGWQCNIAGKNYQQKLAVS